MSAICTVEEDPGNGTWTAEPDAVDAGKSAGHRAIRRIRAS